MAHGVGDIQVARGLGVAAVRAVREADSVGRHHGHPVRADDAVPEAVAEGVDREAIEGLADYEDVDAVVAGEVDGVAILAGRGDRTAGEGDGSHRVEERVVEVDIHRAATLLEDGVGGVPVFVDGGGIERGAVGGGGAAGGDDAVDLGVLEHTRGEGGHRGAAELHRMDGTTIGTGKCGRPHRLQRGAQRDTPGDCVGDSGNFGKSLLTNTRAAVAHPEIRA